LLVCLALEGRALTPAELKAQLDAGTRLTIIDVRSTDRFSVGHIPGAINVPAAVCVEKKLPPLGRAVIYDEGLGKDQTAAAAAALNLKPGIAAEVLDGGFAAWEMTPGVLTTRGRGADREALPLITYQDLKLAQSNNVVLVDLRNEGVTNEPGIATKSLAGASAGALTDLHAEFPAAKLSPSPFRLPPALKSLSGAAPVPPLLVLIDQGDGTAEQTARLLRANGVTRVVILAGGEEILARQGQRGLQRQGSTTTAPAAPPPTSTPGNP